MKSKVYKKLLSSIIFFLSSVIVFSQSYKISGKIMDETSREPLAFVNIVANNGQAGVTSSIEGYFSIQSNTPIDSLRFSYVGYLPKTIYKNELTNKLSVLLTKQNIELQEVVILPTENPAHRIIDKTIANKDVNNPFKNSSFSYVSYNKMIFTSDVVTDTTAIRIAADTTLTDSLNKSFKEVYRFFDEQHIFLMESVNQRIFKAPSSNYEKVIASKVSGFKDPFFTLLITQIQGISFYDDMFIILDKKYVNPISSGSTSRYFFLMQDTLYPNPNTKDTVFVISYRPRRNTNFDGLEGLLYINTNGYAIQNVTAYPTRDEGGISINIQQQYELIDKKKWFPVQLNTELSFKNIKIDNNFSIIAKGWTYLKDIELDKELKRRDFGKTEIDLDVVSEKQSNEILEKYRPQALNEKEQKTYQVIDSIGKIENIDRTVNILKALSSGYFPVSIFDIAIDKIIWYNRYEGFRFGAGFRTNRRLLKNASIGAYYGYSLRNKYSNYGFNTEIYLSRKHDLKINLDYHFDIAENGRHKLYFLQNALLASDVFRKFYVTRYNHIRTEAFAISGKPTKYTSLKVGFARNTVFPGFDYQNINSDDLYNKDNPAITSEAKIALRYAPNEKIINDDNFKFLVNNDFPILIVQYSHSFDNLLNSNYQYNKLDLYFTKSHTSKYYGKSNVILKAGFIDRDLPLWGLYAFTSNLNKEYIYSSNSFSTMPFNKYYSSSSVELFFQHNFGKLIYRGKKFQPEFMLHQNIAFGWSNEKQYFQNQNITVPEKGYFESGISINNLLNLKFYSFGIGAFYHYGPYSSSDFYSNIALKWGISFPF
ncbi:MAG: DUF5686 family protein [Bacteroidales bacterium]|nr:DUF5686 family protein [Bacteroidales bacterium]